MSPRFPRLTAALVTTFAVVALAPITVAHAGVLVTCDSGAFAGGDGSAGSPYQVGSRSAFEEVRDCLDQHFVQTADIDLGGTEWTPIGSNEGYGPKFFIGTYDGADTTITGLSITVDSTYGVGLFGASSGTLKNVHVAGSITLSGSSIFVGGLVGLTFGSIEHSSASVAISASDSDQVGGLVGQISPGSLASSSASGSVTGRSNVGGLAGAGGGVIISTSVATGAVTGAERVGGLVGSFGDSSVISTSYARGSVTSAGTGGGLVGALYLNATIASSYSTGAVTAVTAGGFVGSLDEQTYYTFTANLWDSQTSGRSGDGSSVGTTGLTTADMTSLVTFTGYSWDIDRSGEKVWQICAGINDGYPFLTAEGREVLSCTETLPTTPPTVPTTLPPTGGDTTSVNYVIALLAIGVTLVVAVRRRPAE